MMRKEPMLSGRYAHVDTNINCPWSRHTLTHTHTSYNKNTQFQLQIRINHHNDLDYYIHTIPSSSWSTLIILAIIPIIIIMKNGFTTGR